MVGGGVVGLDLDAGVAEAALVEIEYGFDEIGCTDLSGAYGLAMEAQRLGCDLADSGEFALCSLNVVADAFGEISG